MGKVFSYNNISFELHESLSRYYQLLAEFTVDKNKLYEEVFELISLCSNVDKIIECIDKYLQKSVTKTIHILENNNVFDTSIEDLKEFNPGYLSLIKTYIDCYEQINNIQSKNAILIENQLESASKEANAMIKGLDFGIVSNDIFSLMMYDSMKDSKIKKQVREAEKYYESVSKAIINQHSATEKQQIEEYLSNTFKERIVKSINEFYSFLLASVVKAEGLLLNNTDEDKSNKILKNIDISTNKKKIIESALMECPFNLNIFKVALHHDLFETGLYDLLYYFDVKDVSLKNYFIQYINELLTECFQKADLEKGIQIIYADNEYLFSILKTILGKDEISVFLYKKFNQEYVRIYWMRMRERIKKFCDFLYTGKAENIIKYVKDELGLKDVKVWEEVLLEQADSIIYKPDIDYINACLDDDIMAEVSDMCRQYGLNDYQKIMMVVQERLGNIAKSLDEDIERLKTYDIKRIEEDYAVLIKNTKPRINSGLKKYMWAVPIIFFIMILFEISDISDIIHINWLPLCCLIFVFDWFPYMIYKVFFWPNTVERNDKKRKQLESEKKKKIDEIQEKYR